MSTTSMGTALAEIDLTLGDDTRIANWICIQVAIQGNGTPLGPTSFRDEDAIAVHRVGPGAPRECAAALGYQDCSSIPVQLQYNGHIMSLCCGHGLVWHAWQAPYLASNDHAVSDYIATQSSHPVALGHLSRVRVGYPTPPSEPHLDNGPQMELTRDLWNLDDDQLWEVLEAGQLKAARKEGAATHMGHPWLVWGSLGMGEQLIWMMGKWPSDGEGLGTRWAHAVVHKPPLGWWGCKPPPQHTCS